MRTGGTERTLRLALAMRGGVSLAVWIGGAVAELDVLRRAGTPGAAGDPDDTAARRREGIYAALLTLGGYDRVEIDVLAGASAGGLNAVLYAVAQSAGATAEGLSEDWMELADLGNLLRPARWRWSSRSLGAPSVLRGDSYFLRTVARRLEAMLRGPESAGAAPPEHLSVVLSATMLPTGDAREPLADEGRAYFQFVGRPAPPGSWISDIPRRGAGVTPIRIAHQIARLALAGRCTSSFPGAFEPGLVHAAETCAREPHFHGVGRDAPEMVDVFSASHAGADESSPFQVVDGGVFDNIPITRALHAIALTPATGRTDRRLVYLDPDPPKEPPRRVVPGEAAPDLPSSRARRPVYGGLATVRRALAMLKSSESARADLEELRAHNSAAAAHRAAVGAYTCQLWQLLGTPDVNPAAVTAKVRALTDPSDRRGVPFAAYAGHRATADLPRITELLLRPQQSVGRQILFAHLTPVRDANALLGRRPPLLACYLEAPTDLSRDLSAVIAVTGFLIAWARAAELAEPEVGVARLAQCKQQLYRVLTVAVAFRDRSEHELPRSLCGGWPTEARLRPALDRMWAQQDVGVTPELRTALHDLKVGPAEFHGNLADALTGPRGAANLRDTLWDRLDETFGRLHQVAVPSTEEWRRSPFHLLSTVPGLRAGLVGSGAGAGVHRLGLLFAPAGGLLGPTADVLFEELTGDEPPTVLPSMAGSYGIAITERADGLLRGEVLPDGPWCDSRSKLAGNQLANFGGFLSRRWRANDWMWGRADAAATIPRLVLGDLDKVAKRLTDPGPQGDAARTALAHLGEFTGVATGRPVDLNGADQNPEVAREVARRALQISILADGLPGVVAAEDPPAPTSVVAARPAPGGPTAAVCSALRTYSVGGERIASLPPAYRGRLVVRTVLAVHQSLWPTGSGIGPTLGRILLLLLRPVVLLAALVAVPARAALVVTVVLLAPTFVSGSTDGQGTRRAVVLACVLGGSALLAAYRAWTTDRLTRAACADLRGSAATSNGPAAIQAKGRSRRQLRATALVAVAALGTIPIALWSPGVAAVVNSVPFTGYLLLVVVAAALPVTLAAAALEVGSVRADRRGRWQEWTLWAVAGLVVVGSLLPVGHLPDPLVLAGASVLSVGVATAGWFRWWWVALAVAVGGTLGWAVGGLGTSPATVVGVLAASLVVASSLFPAAGEVPDVPATSPPDPEKE